MDCQYSLLFCIRSLYVARHFIVGQCWQLVYLKRHSVGQRIRDVQWSFSLKTGGYYRRVFSGREFPLVACIYSLFSTVGVHLVLNVLGEITHVN